MGRFQLRAAAEPVKPVSPSSFEGLDGEPVLS